MRGQLSQLAQCAQEGGQPAGTDRIQTTDCSAVSSKTARTGKASWAITSGRAVCRTRPANATDVPASVAKYQFARNGINPATRPATKPDPFLGAWTWPAVHPWMALERPQYAVRFIIHAITHLDIRSAVQRDRSRGVGRDVNGRFNGRINCSNRGIPDRSGSRCVPLQGRFRHAVDRPFQFELRGVADLGISR